MHQSRLLSESHKPGKGEIRRAQSFGHNAISIFSQSRLMWRLDPAIRPLQYKLALSVNPDAQGFSGLASIRIQCASPTQAILLHALDLRFSRIEATAQDGQPQTAAHETLDHGTLRLTFPNALSAGQTWLHFAYEADFASGLEGLYRARNGESWAAFTQCEALGARRVFPCFDEPGFKAPFSVELTVPRGLTAFSNAAEAARNTKGETTTITFADTRPLPTYLVAFAIGKFDVASKSLPAGNIERAPLQLRTIARQGQGPRSQMVLDWLSAIIPQAETYFGIAYPFDKLDILAVPDFAAGGMENAGLIMLEETLVLLDDDSNFDQFRDSLTTLAHEIVHHWFGNLVTPAWWDDLWLNESFATLMEAKFAHLVRPDWGYDGDVQRSAAEAMRLDLLPSVRRVHQPVTDEDAVTTAFDAITYQKGAVALAILEVAVGEDVFRKAIHTLLSENQFGTYDTQKFVASFAKAGANPAALQAFQDLIATPGLPVTNQAAFLQSASAAPYYQRASLATATWQSIIAQASAMPKPQAQRAFTSLDLALQKQEIAFPLYLSAVEAIAANPEWDIASLPLNRLEYLIIERPARGDLKDLAAKYYANVFQSLGTVPRRTSASYADWRFVTQRGRLAQFFAITDASPTIELDLLHAGQRLLAHPQGPFEAEWFPKEMKEPALLAALRSKDAGVAQHLLSLLKTTDTSWQRDSLIDVLGADAAPDNQARQSELLEGGVLLNHEITTYLNARASDPMARDSLLELVRLHADDILPRLNGDADIGIVQFADSFTTEAQAQTLATIMTPLLPKIHGGAPQLQLTLEKIRLHAAMLKAIDG